MNIKEILNSNANIQISVGIAELKEFALCVANEIMARYEKQPEEVYWTADQTAKRFQVDKSTLWRWAKQNYLIPIKVGGKTRYKESDIKKIMEG